MIKINQISKSFGSYEALKSLSLEVKKGEFYSLLGPNGAGKTTCINIISNIMPASSGNVEIAGFNSKTDASEIKKRIGVVPQEIALYEDLSAIENLKFWGKINQVENRQLNSKIEEILKFLDLYDQRNQKISTYSGGMKRRINIAAALLHDPEVLFMDEPTVGIDPQSRLFTYEVFEKLHQQGKTIFYTSHNMEEVERLSDRIGIIDHGQLIAEGSLSELKEELKMEETLVIKTEKPINEDTFNTIKTQLPGAINQEQQLLVSSKNTNQDLAWLFRTFDKMDIQISSIEIQKVNLEMIFLKLTGKKLRD
jgi:ABC-2 type transport system ATP-binding protein